MSKEKQLQFWALTKYTADKTVRTYLFLPLIIITIMVLIPYELRHFSKVCVCIYTEALSFFI